MQTKVVTLTDEQVLTAIYDGIQSVKDWGFIIVDSDRLYYPNGEPTNHFEISYKD